MFKPNCGVPVVDIENNDELRAPMVETTITFVLNFILLYDLSYIYTSNIKHEHNIHYDDTVL